MKFERFRKPLLVAFAVIVILFLAGLIGTPYLIDMGLERWIASRGPEIVQVENVDFNPFSGRLSMDNLVVETKSGRTLTIAQAYLTFSWKQLFIKQLYLKELVLRETFLRVDRLGDSGFRVGGLILSELAGGAEAKSDKPGWEVGIGRFELQKARVDYDTPELAATYFIDEYTLTGLETWDKQKPVQMELAGRINESPVHIRAEIKPLDVVRSWKGSIILEKGSLELFSKVRGLQEYAPTGFVDIDLKVNAEMQADAGIILDAEGTVALNNLQLQYEGYALQQEKVAWQGSIAGSKAAAQKLTLEVDGKLAANDLALESSVKSLQLQLGVFNWQGKAGLNRQEDASITFGSDGTVDLSKLQLQYEGNGLKQENIAWQGSMAGSKTAAQKLTLEVDGKLAGNDLALESSVKSLQVQLGVFSWQGKAGINQQEESLVVTMESGLDGDDVSVRDLQNDVGLLGLKKFNVDGIKISSLENIRVAQADLQKLRLVEKRNGTDEGEKEAVVPLLQAAAIAISNTSLETGNDLSIESINLNDLQADIRRNKDGSWQIIPAVPRSSPETIPVEPVAEGDKVAADAKPFRLRLNEVQTGGSSFVNVTDESLRQPFHTTFHIKELQVAGLDTGNSDPPARLKIEGQVEDYGTLTFGGTLKPADKPITLDMKGTINALDMVPFTAYTGKTIGYNVTNGQMDADIVMNIDRGKMDGTFDLRLRKFEIAKVDPDKVAEIDNQMDVPLGTALSMLRNKKDEISLKLELKGEIDKPEFGIKDAINQALARAMKYAALSYLKYTLQPFGTYITIAQVVGKAGKEIAKVRLDPITFPAAEIVLDETASQYLVKVQEVLSNRPELRIELCGKAVARDRIALLERRQALEKKEQKQGEIKKETAAVEEAVSDEILLDFARERAKLVKEALVNQYSINHERIYLCLPEIDDTPDKEPYVELLLD